MDSTSGCPFCGSERKDYSDKTKDLLALVEKLIAKEQELEREQRLIRQAEGIASAKVRGVQFGRPAISVPDNFDETVTLWERSEISYKEALRRTGLKHTTFYCRLRERRKTNA
jgi:DNA invertase Pin-like site-specific DNA recombinase